MQQGRDNLNRINGGLRRDAFRASGMFFFLFLVFYLMVIFLQIRHVIVSSPTPTRPNKARDTSRAPSNFFFTIAGNSCLFFHLICFLCLRIFLLLSYYLNIQYTFCVLHNFYCLMKLIYVVDLDRLIRLITGLS